MPTKIITIPKTSLGTVTEIDEQGVEHPHTAIVADNGDLIDLVSSVLIGEPAEEDDAAGDGKRVAIGHDFKQASLDKLKARCASAVVGDALPSDWKPKKVTPAGGGKK